MSLLGLDWGARFIGYATADDSGTVITPRGHLERKIPQDKAWQLFKRDLEQLSSLITEWEIQRIIIGLPLHADGRPSDGSTSATRLAHELAERLKLPVETFDERLTSWEGKNHGEAAALILKNYFAHQNAKEMKKT